LDRPEAEAGREATGERKRARHREERAEQAAGWVPRAPETKSRPNAGFLLRKGLHRSSGVSASGRNYSA